MRKNLKVSSNARWNAPYLDICSSTPTLGTVTLPSKYIDFRGGTYCHLLFVLILFLLLIYFYTIKYINLNSNKINFI